MSDHREILAGGTFRVLIHFLLHPERRLHFRGLQEPLAAIGRATTAAQLLLQRVVDVERYTPASLADKLARGSRFLREAMEGPKTWLIGSEDALAAS
ncbi:MAG TPA: hypothetical protein VM890_08940 [Longimicrobium sp.]|nr:hypothetical protein [Longimicrobium sp.]